MYTKRHNTEDVWERKSHSTTQLSRVTVYCSVLYCIAVCCSVLQCIAMCCSQAKVARARLCVNVSVYIYMYIYRHIYICRDCHRVRLQERARVRVIARKLGNTKHPHTPIHPPKTNTYKNTQ